MSEELTTKEWLEGEKAAVVLKLAEVETAKHAYLDSYHIAKSRLQKGEAELTTLIEAQP